MFETLKALSQPFYQTIEFWLKQVFDASDAHLGSTVVDPNML
jgi:hypothetical protein